MLFYTVGVPHFGAEFCLLRHVQGLISVIEEVLLHMVFFKIWKGW